MALAHVGQLTSGSSTSNVDTYDTASVTLTAGRLYVMGVTNSDAASETAPSSVAAVGGAVSFTQVAGASVGFNTAAAPVHFLSTWWAIPGSTVTDAIRVTLPDAGTSCLWILEEFTGAHASPAGQTTTNTAATANSISATLPSVAGAGSYQIAFGSAAANATTDTASGTDWASSGTGVSIASPSGLLEAALNTAGAATQVTFGTGAANRGIVVMEILPAAGGGSTQPPRSMHQHRMRAA